MFRNKWNLKIAKMRFALPSSAVWRGYDDLVYIAEGKDGCVEIFPESAEAPEMHNKSRVFTPVFTEKKKQRECVILRITIPCEFKRSYSFYCGRKITVVRESDRIVIWPGWVPVT